MDELVEQREIEKERGEISEKLNKEWAKEEKKRTKAEKAELSAALKKLQQER